MLYSAVAIRAQSRVWLRGKAVYRDGWIELDREHAETFQPLEQRSLVFDLAEIRSPADAVAFAWTWGLLWHGDTDGDLRERFTDWENAAITLRGLLTIADLLRRADDGDADATDELRETWKPVLTPSFEAAASDDRELLNQAGVFLGWAISEGLAGAEERLDCAAMWAVGEHGENGRPSQFLFNVQAKHLVHYAYHELALLLVRRMPLRACVACGRFYVVDDPRKRYCAQSCAARTRQHRYRTRSSSRSMRKGVTDSLA